MSKSMKSDNSWRDSTENVRGNDCMRGSDCHSTIQNSEISRGYDKRDDYESKRGEYYESNMDKGVYEDKRRNDIRDDRRRLDDRRRFEGRREYDSRDERLPRYPVRYDERRRFGGYRGEYPPMRYEERKYGGYRGYDDVRYPEYRDYGRGREYGRYPRGDYYGGRYWSGKRDMAYPTRRVVRRDDAPPNVTIALFNLNRDTTKDDLDKVIDNILRDEVKNQYVSKVIIDNHTGRCRGYGFITFEKIEDAIKAKGLLENIVILGNTVRIAFSIDDSRRNNNGVGNEVFENKKEEPEEGELKQEESLAQERND